MVINMAWSYLHAGSEQQDIEIATKQYAIEIWGDCCYQRCKLQFSIVFPEGI